MHKGRSPHSSVNMGFLHRGGLWREISVTQPPCKTITVSMFLELYGDIPHRPELSCEAGIKMGELLDFIEEEMRHHPECIGSFSNVKNFDTAEHASNLPYGTSRCKVSNGEVCRPAQLPERHCHSDFEHSQDSESNDGQDGPQGDLGDEDHEVESE